MFGTSSKLSSSSSFSIGSRHSLYSTMHVPSDRMTNVPMTTATAAIQTRVSKFCASTMIRRIRSFSSMSGVVVAVMVTISPEPSALFAQIRNSYVVFGIRW
uniref:(northern house mosquito) hypothetical protein n=1 Tax=Culex pipiens TaxID=7175 RepID=A0A8D8GZB3_CULPI